MAKMKVIYSPTGEKEVHSFANAHDLLNHAGYTARKVDTKAEVEVEEVDSVDSAEEVNTDIPDFEAMSKEDLEDYAAVNFNVNLDKRKSQPTLASETLALYEDHTNTDED